jgi:hypothetical protein
MNYEEYIAYHRQGDAGVEERMIASLCKHYRLDGWDSFRLIYFYTMTYHIPSALAMLLEGERDMKRLKFRTDRRYVRCNGAYDRLLEELKRDKYEKLLAVSTTQDAYDEVSKWFFFGRYAAFLFLEVYMNVFSPSWIDNVAYGWEPDENYTKGAVHILGTDDREKLDKFLKDSIRDTGENAFSIETSLCSVAKFVKGTRWNGYYTERMLEDARGTKYEGIINKLLVCQ